jgi:hypothetical protein
VSNEVQRSQQSSTRSHTSSSGVRVRAGWAASNERAVDQREPGAERHARHSENREKLRALRQGKQRGTRMMENTNEKSSDRVSMDEGKRAQFIRSIMLFICVAQKSRTEMLIYIATLVLIDPVRCGCLRRVLLFF